MGNRMRILVGGGLLALMTASFLVHLAGFFLPPLTGDNGMSARWDYVGAPYVSNVDPSGPAAGRLQTGDEIIAINGVKFLDNPSVLIDAPPTPPGTRMSITVQRAGRLLETEIVSVPDRKKVEFDTDILVVALYLLIAWFVFLFRSEDKQACLLAFMLAATSGVFGFEDRNVPRWLMLIPTIAGLLGSLFFPILLHFFLIFPEKSRFLNRWPWLERVLYFPYLVTTLPLAIFSKIPGVFASRVPQLGPILSGLAILTNVTVNGYLALCIVAIVFNYKDVDALARRKLRLVMAGSVAGVLNLFLLNFGWLTGLDSRFSSLWSWLNPATSITLPLIPLAFAYAIIRHRVIPVSLIIRRGVRYILVSRGSVLLEILAVVSVITVLLTLVFNHFQAPGIVVGLVSALLGVAAWRYAKTLHNRYLAPVIDRKFFRQAYDSQQIMNDLATSLRSTTSVPQLVEHLASKIQAALQTENVVVLLKDGKTGDFEGVPYQPASNSSLNLNGHQTLFSQSKARLPKFSQIAAKLESSGEPLEIDLDDKRLNGVVEADETSLRSMNSALLSPLIGKQGMDGIISVGPRLGEVPFSGEDKRLLVSLAGPATFALENVRLLDRMVEEARKRKEIEAENEARARELEEARQLQLSMLPKKIPQLSGLEIAAYMKPATEVGGDYYDFRFDGDNVLTIAIGDATGHGLKAGSVVTAMKSMFYLLDGETPLTAALERSSRALKQMNLRGLYMALTLIRIEGDRFRIASGGMPPILIYRANSGVVEEIEFRALPLGSLQNYVYHERESRLYPGDVVALMSDGLPERFNPDGEMFDYPRVRRALEDSDKSSAQQIIEQLVRAGDEWSGGRPQDDDITFVLLKVNGPLIGRKEPGE